MKGLLFLGIYGSVSKTLLQVPYAGAMVVHYDLIGFDTYSTLQAETGTLKIFPSGISGDVSVGGIGSFSVSNGSLRFTSTSYWPAVQIGLHGTILAGTNYELNSWQSGNESLSVSG